MLELLNILARRSPKYVLEIGTWDGGTLFLFAQIAAPDATVISVDLPEELARWRIPFFKSFAKSPAQNVVVLRSDSHKMETVEKIRKIIGPHKLDFLFIDGDHTYEGVKKDFEMYSSLVGTGGLIAFHDIVEFPPNRRIEVSRFWNEIKQRYSYTEIIQDRNQKRAGIGVLNVL
jgi:predicted O-methyltransferase YrrM